LGSSCLVSDAAAGEVADAGGVDGGAADAGSGMVVGTIADAGAVPLDGSGAAEGVAADAGSGSVVGTGTDSALAAVAGSGAAEGVDAGSEGDEGAALATGLRAVEGAVLVTGLGAVGGATRAELAVEGVSSLSLTRPCIAGMDSMASRRRFTLTSSLRCCSSSSGEAASRFSGNFPLVR